MDDRGELVERIYEEYQRFMYVIAYDVLQDRFLAEDAVHEAVIRLMKANALEIPSVSAASTKGLVRLVTKNEAIRIYRKHKKKAYHTEVIKENYVSADSGMEFRVELEEFLNHIPPIYCDVAILHVYFGYDYETVARLLGIQPQTAKNRMVKLRKLIEIHWMGGMDFEWLEKEKDRRGAV